MSAMVKTSGVSTRPEIIRRCLAGSTSATPAWCRSKQSPFGVMMPSSSCSGVKFTEDTGSAVSQGTLRLTTCARSAEHTSELQTLMRISYAVFCLKQKTHQQNNNHTLYIKQD